MSHAVALVGTDEAGNVEVSLYGGFRTVEAAEVFMSSVERKVPAGLTRILEMKYPTVKQVVADGWADGGTPTAAAPEADDEDLLGTGPAAEDDDDSII